MQAWITKKVRELLAEGHLPDAASLVDPVSESIPNKLVQDALPIRIRYHVGKALNTLGYRATPVATRANEDGTTAPSHVIIEQEPFPELLAWLRENILRRDRDYQAERAKVEAWVENHPEVGLTVEGIYELVGESGDESGVSG